MRRALLAGGLVALTLLALAAVTIGAEPTLAPTAPPADLLAGGDLRSEGAGPGLVGNPLAILLAVVALGVITAAVTVVFVRLARRD